MVWRTFPIALAAAETVPQAPPSTPAQENAVTSAITIRKNFPETWIWNCNSSGLVIKLI